MCGLGGQSVVLQIVVGGWATSALGPGPACDAAAAPADGWFSRGHLACMSVLSRPLWLQPPIFPPPRTHGTPFTSTSGSNPCPVNPWGRNPLPECSLLPAPGNRQSSFHLSCTGCTTEPSSWRLLLLLVVSLLTEGHILEC